MDAQTEALLLKEIGAIGAKLDAVHDAVKDIKPQIRILQERQTKHTTILTVVGSALLFLKDKILGVFNI